MNPRLLLQKLVNRLTTFFSNPDTKAPEKMTGHEGKVVKNKDGVWTVDGRPRETVKPLSQTSPSNIPGMTVITVLIEFPPNGASPPHTHSGAAVTAMMLRGKTRNQMNKDPAFDSEPGDSFFESPGCHHVLSENLSKTESAAFYASLIIAEETIAGGHYEKLLVVDAEKEEEEEKKRKEQEGKGE